MFGAVGSQLSFIGSQFDCRVCTVVNGGSCVCYWLSGVSCQVLTVDRPVPVSMIVNG